MERLAEVVELSELMNLIVEIKQVNTGQPNLVIQTEAAALLGGVARSKIRVSEAFDIYCEDIAIGDLSSKSPNQKRL